MELAELHRRVVDAWLARVEAVPADAWGRSTPCEDWDVRFLVNHVVGEELWTRPITEGRTVDEVGDQFDGDVLGQDPASAARSAAREAVDAVEEMLPHEGIVHLSFGDFPIAEYVWQLSADHLIHGWDLAAATGQDRTLEPELVEGVAAWFADREDLYRSAGAVGPRRESGPDPAAQLLAGFGRDPGWEGGVRPTRTLGASLPTIP